MNRALKALLRPLTGWCFNQPSWAPDRRRIIALGDSHLEIIHRYVAPRVTAIFDTVVVHGATAQGMVNPNSSTDALRLFQSRLDRARHWQTILLELGEVDCGFVIWYRAEKHNMTVEDQLELSLQNYMEFVDRQVARGYDVWVMSAPLPTILDNQDWGEVANLRRTIGASQTERTALTVRYNNLLHQHCLDRRVRFIDVSSEQLDPGTGTIKRQFIHPNRLDHHLDESAWGSLIVQKLTAPEGNPQVGASKSRPAVLRRRGSKPNRPPTSPT